MDVRDLQYARPIRRWTGERSTAGVARMRPPSRSGARTNRGVDDLAKATGLRRLPSKSWGINEAWCQVVALAVDLSAWLRHLTLDGDLARAEPETLRYRLLHTAARITHGQRQRWINIPPNLALGQTARHSIRPRPGPPGADLTHGTAVPTTPGRSSPPARGTGARRDRRELRLPHRTQPRSTSRSASPTREGRHIGERIEAGSVKSTGAPASSTQSR